MSNQSIVRYSSLAQVFHWLTAILVLIAFIYGPEEAEENINNAGGDFGQQLHETLGLAVLGLTILRVLWRMLDANPEPPAVARWMGVVSKAVQGFLYLLLFAVPLTAITGIWLEGHPLTLLAGVSILPMFATSHSTGETIMEIHTWLGDAIMWVAGFHALAAIFHHYFLRDGVLVSMLPRWRSGRR
jgi:cytochrome b561